jgi:hypothetical protein
MRSLSIFNRSRNSLDRKRAWFAEGDITFYNSAKQKLGDGSIDWDTDTINCMLIATSAAHTPDIDTHEDYADVSADEAANTNYVAKGDVLTPSAPTKDTVNDWAEYDSTDASWTALGNGDVSHAIVFKDSGTPATSWLICYVELGTTQPNGGDYTISWHADGVFKIV